MTNIQFLKDRIIIDGHAETKQECETITLLCDNLAKSKDFKTVRYESGYAEFEKVGATNGLMFAPAQSSVTIIFDSHVTKIDYIVAASSFLPEAAGTLTSSGQSIDTTEGVTLNCTLQAGYVIDTVAWSAYEPDSGDSMSHTDTSVSCYSSVAVQGTITITTKQTGSSTPKQTIDLSTLSGWANLANGSHQITVKAKASGYADSAASNAVSVEKAPQAYTDCLTFTGKTSDFTLKATNGKVWDGTLEWSTDHNTWTTLAGMEEMQSVDKKLYLRGKNTTFYDSAKYKSVQWVLSAEADCIGNIQTLLDYEIKPTSISKNYCYCEMFRGCTNLTSAPELPATTLAEGCYEGMFRGCTRLTATPELPATTLAERCYFNMFFGCTSLTSASELPATTLAEYCYYSMFNGCTSLTAAPKLLATTLATACCYSMFEGCTSLTTAPELLATTLVRSCYPYMFDGCVNLKVNTVSGTKIFTCPSTIPDVAVNNMFRSTGGTFTGTPTAGNTYYYTV